MYYLLCTKCTILTQNIFCLFSFSAAYRPRLPCVSLRIKAIHSENGIKQPEWRKYKHRAWHLSAGESQIVSLINQKWQKDSFHTWKRAGSETETHRETLTPCGDFLKLHLIFIPLSFVCQTPTVVFIVVTESVGSCRRLSGGTLTQRLPVLLNLPLHSHSLD